MRSCWNMKRRRGERGRKRSQNKDPESRPVPTNVEALDTTRATAGHVKKGHVFYVETFVKARRFRMTRRPFLCHILEHNLDDLAPSASSTAGMIGISSRISKESTLECSILSGVMLGIMRDILTMTGPNTDDNKV